MSKISINNIEKSFNNLKVLSNINFNVENGQVVSLLGPSGCGKTTTLKIIAGLLKPDKGSIYIGGKDITNVSIENRGTFLVFQDYLLFPHINVEENIGFGLKMSRVPKKDRLVQVEEMLELVQLKGYNNKYPHELSGGQKQRVALARALALKPKILLLDEPFSNLDRKLREGMREFTFDIQKRLSITTILVTHDKEEALMSSHKVAIMLNGQIKQFGTPEELYRRPNSKEVADFFSDNNYLDGYISNGVFISELISFKTSREGFNKVKAMIKQEDIQLLDKSKTGKIGVISSRSYAGDKVFYKVKIKGIELKVKSSYSKHFEIGDNVSVDFNYENIILFNID